MRSFISHGHASIRRLNVIRSEIQHFFRVLARIGVKSSSHFYALNVPCKNRWIIISHDFSNINAIIECLQQRESTVESLIRWKRSVRKEAWKIKVVYSSEKMLWPFS